MEPISTGSDQPYNAMEKMTHKLIDEVNKEKQVLEEEEERNMQRWSEVEKSQTKVIQDEVDLRRIRDKAV